jgi:uncharacterized cupredoxin-like copper-binding protein
MKRLTIPSMLVLAAIAIAALAPAPLASADADPQVSAKEFSFKLSAKSTARPGTVTFNVRNAGSILHDFKINGKKTSLIAPGKTEKLVVRFKKKGQYRYICTVPGHAALGMKGVFTVR